MKINKAISLVMKNEGVTQSTLAQNTGLKDARFVSSKLTHPNMTVDSIVLLLNAMGYELVVQKKTAGHRAKDQISIERSK